MDRGTTLTTTVSAYRINWPRDIVLFIYWNTAGITSSLSTAVLTGGAVTATLTINVSTNAPHGHGAVGVRAISGCLEMDFVVDVNVLSTGGSFVREKSVSLIGTDGPQILARTCAPR